MRRNYYISYIDTDTPYLTHYGVPGQKRGQRRYQNEDGSLTDEGRAHYGVGDPRTAGSSRLKTALKIGAGVAGAAALGYGAYRLARGRGFGNTARRFAASVGNKASGIRERLRLTNLKGAARRLTSGGERIRTRALPGFNPKAIKDAVNRRERIALLKRAGVAVGAAAAGGGTAYAINKRRKRKSK